MPILEMKGITKRFPGVLALNQVNLTIYPGQVLALVGENGAGKSTLMKILSGVHQMDEGEILMEGKPVQITDPLSSQLMGISIIYQELNVLDNLNIAENIFLGREQRRSRVFVDKQQMHAKARELLDEVGLNLDTNTLVRNLSTAQKQMIEVAKALSFHSKIIIMDEPTSSLTETETETLFTIIRKLRAMDVAVVFISHKLAEIFAISDEVAVLRDGVSAGRMITAECSENDIVNAMVGRDVQNLFAKEEAEIGDVVLEVRNLSTHGFLKDVNFELRAGEILGFAGLVGAGRSEVMRAVFGIDKRESGEIYVKGQKADIRSPKDALRYGMGFVPEDRKSQGLVLEMSVRQNTTLAALKLVANGGFIQRKLEDEMTDKFVKSLEVKTPSNEQRVKNLSGGNQQKVVIAKWLANSPSILILDEPTRGIDVGAKKEIHQLMSQLAQQGVAIIMISSELPEVLGMSDRIVVMHEGRVKGVLPRSEADQVSIMKLAVS
jgi:ABC-type sugar transport system ATPase subunit